MDRNALILIRSVQQGELALADMFLGDEACKDIAGFVRERPTLSVVDLKGNNIGAAGVESLRGLFRNSNVKRVCLQWNYLGHEGATEALAEVLKENSSIVEIDLRNNRISDKGAAALARALPSVRVLEKLDLRWNEITNTSGDLLVRSIKGHSSMQKIELAGNPIKLELLGNNTTERKKSMYLPRSISRPSTPLSDRLKFELPRMAYEACSETNRSLANDDNIVNSIWGDDFQTQLAEIKAKYKSLEDTSKSKTNELEARLRTSD